MISIRQRYMRRGLAWGLGVFWLLSGSLCCTSTAHLSPSEMAQNQANAGIEAARTAASRERNVELLLRWNPGPCDCPDFEVHVFEAWQRCELRAEDDLKRRIDAFVESLSGQPVGRFLRVTGTMVWNKDSSRASRGCLLEIGAVEEVSSARKVLENSTFSS